MSRHSHHQSTFTLFFLSLPFFSFSCLEYQFKHQKIRDNEWASFTRSVYSRNSRQHFSTSFLLSFSDCLLLILFFICEAPGSDSSSCSFVTYQNPLVLTLLRIQLTVHYRPKCTFRWLRVSKGHSLIAASLLKCQDANG